MDIFMARIFSGATSGSIYALIALALVAVFRSSSTINFAQGEFALFTTYVAWWLTGHGLNIWVALIPVVVIGFAMGAVAERFIFRPVGKRNEAGVLVVALGLMTGLNGLDGWVWGSDDKPFPEMFPNGANDYISIFGARLHYDTIFVVGFMLLIVGAITLLFNRTGLGLQMRAVASNRESAALAGVDVGRTLTMSWGLSAAIGSFAGVLLVPLVPPGQLGLGAMFQILVFAIAAAILGGLESIKGAVIGGLGLGIGLSLLNGYGTFLGGDLSLSVALVLIVVVLLIKPTGIFGAKRLERV